MLLQLIYPLLAKEAQEYLEKELERIITKDERGQNKDGIVDFDLLMLKVFASISLSKKSNLEHYQIVFSSFDIQDQGLLGF